MTLGLHDRGGKASLQSRGHGTPRAAGRRGQSLVEFSVVTLLTVMMLLFVVEMGRMLLVYTTVANAARAGVRYAIVHGSTRAAGATLSSASGPSNTAQVVTVVTNFASAGPLNMSLLTGNIAVTYPNASNAPGQPVNVIVLYPYDPLTSYFSKTVILGSAAQGIIVY
ncbi:MAG: TadE/TadG family type IV pilus assembly protein [Bryobacteraceae bacterium]